MDLNSQKKIFGKIGGNYYLCKMEERYRNMEPKKYRELVDGITKSNILYEGVKVGKGLSVDHIFPVSIGRTLGLPPELVGDIRNLQIIPLKENMEKSYKCETIPLFIQQHILGIARELVVVTKKDRQKRGVERAKEKGMYTGRKKGSKDSNEKFMSKPKIREVIQLLNEGVKGVVISERLGIHINTITKVKKFLKHNPPLSI
jgi:hypothetical protein